MTTVKPIRIHSRDLAIMRDFLEVGFLDMPTIHARHFPNDKTTKACLRRLRLLCEHDLITTAQISVAYATFQSGRPQRIFRITQRGAEVYATLTGMPLMALHRRDPQPETVLHRLGMAKLRLTVNDACALQDFPKPRWIGEYDTVPGIGLDAKHHERFVLCEKFTTEDGAKATCWADASCHLQIPGNSSGSQQTWHHLLVYWEHDRSTEMLKQVARKMPGYAALLAAEVYRKHWPELPRPTVRVFFVVPSRDRLENIARTIRTMPGSEFVRLAAVGDIIPRGFFTEPVWHTTTCDARPILRNLPKRP